MMHVIIYMKNGHNQDAKEYISDLRAYCKNIAPFVLYYKKQIASYYCTVHNI